MNVDDDKFANARNNAQSWYQSIHDMIACLETSDESSDQHEAIEQKIRESVLSVETRSDWQTTHFVNERGAMFVPAEYRILLTTGGPALRLIGELDQHGEPKTAVLQIQDWFLPWTDYRPLSSSQSGDDKPYVDGDCEDVLLTFARQFYFG